MTKFYGFIGFSKTVESSPGVWTDEIVERAFTGDVITDSRSWKTTENINPDVLISETLSVMADNDTLKNLPTIKYVRWMGASWCVTNIEIKRPRLILTIGGLYNGNTSGASE